jgi:hypothetical protein
LPGRFFDRQAAGGKPTWRLKARLKAASDSSDLRCYRGDAVEERSSGLRHDYTGIFPAQVPFAAPCQARS